MYHVRIDFFPNENQGGFASDALASVCGGRVTNMCEDSAWITYDDVNTTEEQNRLHRMFDKDDHILYVTECLRENGESLSNEEQDARRLNG